MQKEQLNSITGESEQAFAVKSVWLTYYELGAMTKGSSEAKFTEKISEAFDGIKGMGFNTVTVQVRPCADAFYRSEIFPVSEYFDGKQGGKMSYDPLKIICEEGEKRELRIEAWLNPYRVAQNDNISALSDDNIAKKWLSVKSSNVYVDKKIFFNPASDEVVKLIVDGVREIVKNYNVDAIHFDDYFYPTTDEGIDKNEYKKYTDSGGKKTLADWRRENVSKMIKAVYKAIKEENKDVLFGVSPAADIDYNKNKLYADITRWAGKKGYIDYIVPQIYFGFKNENQPFMKCVKRWVSISNCELYIGLPLYKAGKEDKYAYISDKSARTEFIDSDDIILRQVNYIAKIDDIKGYYIFSYGCFSDSRCKKEIYNLINNTTA
jgi:uncharacterized lipoprotein YddW (UPF0748 family)